MEFGKHKKERKNEIVLEKTYIFDRFFYKHKIQAKNSCFKSHFASSEYLNTPCVYIIIFITQWYHSLNKNISHQQPLYGVSVVILVHGFDSKWIT
jgi:hypothetical protein